jgi:hypothetical protein
MSKSMTKLPFSGRGGVCLLRQFAAARVGRQCWHAATLHSLSLHAHLEALVEAAVLALVAVVLVDRTALARAALVRQASAHAPLEEGLAALARVLAVVFAA